MMKKTSSLGLILLLLSAALLGLGTSVGSAGLGWEAVSSQIVWEIRWPRSLGAWLAGALLGLSGALAQGLFRNPLADPYLLGSASGAGLAVAIVLVLLGGGLAGGGSALLLSLGLTGAAFGGAVLAVLLTLLLARGAQQTMRLLLAGVIVGVVLGAVTSLLTAMHPEALLAMQSFMLGSTSFVDSAACTVMASCLAVCMIASVLLARVLDGLALGEETALSLGLPLAPLRMLLVAVLALATGAAVAQTGLIAFVGLAAPHVVRSVVRAQHAALLVLSALAGGCLLLAADVLARGLIAPQELPVGVLTAVLGGGYLLVRMFLANKASQ
jgi:iron complex transport system permease protein